MKSVLTLAEEVREIAESLDEDGANTAADRLRRAAAIVERASEPLRELPEPMECTGECRLCHDFPPFEEFGHLPDCPLAEDT